MKVTLLGCGGSQGVPAATGDWGKCDPADPRNRRRRSAALVETVTPDGTPRTLLIDAPPDLREQLLDASVRRIDAVLFTHGHADHTHGIDDLRSFSLRDGRPIPIYGTDAVLAELAQRFAYTVDPEASKPYRPTLAPHPIAPEFEAAGVPVAAFVQDHGFGLSTGYRIGPFGYAIDVCRLDEAAFAVLAGITHWIVDCQQIEPHPSHSHLAQTLAWIRRVGAGTAVLTHMGSRLDYRTLRSMLPDGVVPGIDGLVLEID